MLETSDQIGGTIIREPTREQVKEAIILISLEGLMPAFEHLRRIRASTLEQLPLWNRRQLYEDFSRLLWHAYKDLMPKAVKLIGFDIGFLFQNDANFEKAVTDFEEANPSIMSGFGNFLRTQRTSWQNALADFRNHHLEHREVGQTSDEDFYKPENAGALFDSAWRTIADILFMFLEKNLPSGFGLREVSPAERAAGYPRRFRFVLLKPLLQGSSV